VTRTIFRDGSEQCPEGIGGSQYRRTLSPSDPSRNSFT